MNDSKHVEHAVFIMEILVKLVIFPKNRFYCFNPSTLQVQMISDNRMWIQLMYLRNLSKKKSCNLIYWVLINPMGIFYCHPNLLNSRRNAYLILFNFLKLAFEWHVAGWPVQCSIAPNTVTYNSGILNFSEIAN